jgi:hypothetical protein
MRNANPVVLICEPAAKCLVVGHIESLMTLVDGRGEEGGQVLANLVDILAVDEVFADWVKLFWLFGEKEGLLVRCFDEG